MKHSKQRIGLVDERPQVIEKNKSGLWFLVVLVVLAAGQSAYVFWQQHSLNQDITLAKEKIAAKEATIAEITSGSGFDEHEKGINILELAEEQRVDWSKAENELARLRRSLESNVIMETYASDPQGMFTLQGVSGSMESVAVLIDTFGSSTVFHDYFVTNIVQQDNPGEYSFNGLRPRTIYRFTLTFNYDS